MTSSAAVSSAKPFAIYYGWPSEVNGANYDLQKAISAFSGYQVVVLGEDTATSAGDTNAPTIIAGITRNGGTPYGYVSIGVTSGEPNYSLSRIQTFLNSWQKLGVGGVFLDCAGLDYGVTRSRLTSVVTAAHQLGLKVLVNAWNPDDVLSGSTPLRAGDGYLGENDVYSDGAWQDPQVYGPKLAAMAAYKKKLGIRLYETATTSSFKDAASVTAKLLAILAPYGVDNVQLTDPNYSASNNVLVAPSGF